MSDELREILKEFFNGGYQEFLQGIKIEYFLEKTIKEINQWHKSERKKWAIDIVEEAKKFLLTTQSISMSSKIGVGITISEIRKEIEED